MNESRIWGFLIDKIGNPFGAAGMMGNLMAESGLNPINLQNTFERKLGYTDETYSGSRARASATLISNWMSYGRSCKRLRAS